MTFVVACNELLVFDVFNVSIIIATDQPWYTATTYQPANFFFNSMITHFSIVKYLPPATKLWLGNVFTPVCQSFRSQGWCLPLEGLGVWPPLGQTNPPGQAPPGRYPPGQRPPLPSACWDTVNKRAVRIPLECILVIYKLYLKKLIKFRNYIGCCSKG